ncbi:MAG TPA: glycosyltransferase family 4 protein [Thermoanaerobaculia bacterium]|nr:glycosyltransferase family 4 protein [Thermoanaerobaculia bacterium]
MRVLLLAPHPFFSDRGTPIAERALLEVLCAEGHEVEVLTFPEGEDSGIPGCRVHRVRSLPGTRGVRPGFSLKKLALDAVMLVRFPSLLRRGRFDVVHAVEESAFLALLGKRLFGVPYVYDMDSGLAQQMVDRFPVLNLIRPLLDACERAAVRGSCGTLAVCRSLEEQARAHHPGGLVARLEDPSLLGAAEGSAVNLVPEDWRGLPLVLYVGNLQPYQGIDLLLAAFAHAVKEIPEARLAVVGGDAGSIERYRRHIGDDRVWFAGPRPLSELGIWLRQATVLVSPRLQGTNTPMKLYSYLDSGRPVLATRLPTHTQILDDDVALLVEPDPEAMGRGLVRLLRDELLRERLAGAARRLAQRELTLEAFRRKLLGFYEEMARAQETDVTSSAEGATTARRSHRRSRSRS